MRPSLGRLGLALGGIAVAVLAIEAALVIAGVAFPQPYITDHECGTRLQPGFSAWFTAEGKAWVQINSAGFRDREHRRKKPAGTFRIAVLGDSYTEAVQVDQRDTFWLVLERELQNTPELAGRRVEVLNFGVSGFGTAQELQALRHHVRQFQPDLVLLAFLTGNDIQDNSRVLAANQVKPFFDLKNERLVLDASFRQHPDFLKAQSGWTNFKVALINRSRLLQCIAQWRSRKRSPSASGADQVREPGLSESCYRKPRDADWKAAWNITERLLEEMNDEARRMGARFCVATLSNGIQVHPNPEVRAQFERRLEVPNLFYADRRVARLGRRLDFRVVVLAERMQRYAERQGEYLHGFGNTELGTGHWNAKGHRLAGQWIAEAIRDELGGGLPH